MKSIKANIDRIAIKVEMSAWRARKGNQSDHAVMVELLVNNWVSL